MTTLDDLDARMVGPKWSDVRQARVRLGFDLLKWLTPAGETIQRIFMDSLKEGAEGNESLWALTESYWLNARLDEETWSTDVSVLRDSIGYLGVEFQEATSTPESARRVTVEIQTDRTGYSSLYAVEEEIGELVELVEECFKPNLKRTPAE